MALPEQTAKPTFLRSTWEGIKGYIKGAIAGAAIGAAGGALISAGVATAAALIAGTPISWALAGVAALAGAIDGSITLGFIGATAGAVTGVIKSREAGQPSTEALVGALNMAHQHGEMVGQQQMVQQLMAAQQAAEKGTRWQDAEKARTQARGPIAPGMPT